MELTITSIVAFVTLILGHISKKVGLVDKKYIPYQTLFIGIISGILCYLTELQDNILISIFTCLISSLSASGLYDAYEVHTKN